jgi:hypothetical protein
MATTCLDIVTYAMRQSRIIGPGREPRDAEAEEGMVALQSLYDQWRTGGMFGRLADVYLSGDANAQEGKRYYVPAGVTLTDATNDYVPDYPLNDYGCGCDYGSGISTGVTRQPYDVALYEVVDSSGNLSAKLYDRSAWVDLLDLALTDIAPLSSRNAYGLAACLATSGGFVSVFGGEPPSAISNLAAQFTRNLSSKFGSSQDMTGDLETWM